MMGNAQEATFVSRIGVIKYLTDGSGNYTSVASINPSNIIDISSIAAIFDEQQPIRSRVTFYPSGLVPAATAASGLNCAVIDWADATTISSDNAALAYDTCKMFHVTTTKTERVTWDVPFVGQPDRAWLKTGTSVNLAYWKPWTFANLPNSLNTYYGIIVIEMESKFRQIS